MADVSSALDFGCSSGRVLRVLRAAYPLRLGKAVTRTRRRRVGGREPARDRLLCQRQRSPATARGCACWTWYAPSRSGRISSLHSACRWFEEMHRILRPGGASRLHHPRPFDDRPRCAPRPAPPGPTRGHSQAIYRRNHWYAPEFGDEGDWGVVNPDWGTAFLSPEWMLAQLCPRWRVLEFEAGRNHGNQDVYVLERA